MHDDDNDVTDVNLMELFERHEAVRIGIHQYRAVGSLAISAITVIYVILMAMVGWFGSAFTLVVLLLLLLAAMAPNSFSLDEWRSKMTASAVQQTRLTSMSVLGFSLVVGTVTIVLILPAIGFFTLDEPVFKILIFIATLMVTAGHAVYYLIAKNMEPDPDNNLYMI